MYNETKVSAVVSEKPQFLSIADSMIKEISTHPLEVQIEMLNHIITFMLAEWNAMIESKDKDLAYSKECYNKLTAI